MKVNAADTIIEVGGIKIGPSLTKEQAEKLYGLGQEAVVFVLMTQAKMITQQIANSAETPSAPSSAKPVYRKENKSKKKRRKKSGAKKGHAAFRRAKPVHIDRRQEHQLETCPDCGSKNLSRSSKKRTRIIIDIPEGFNVETAEHTIVRSWCPDCKKIVEPKVPDALAKCTFGNRILAFSAWLHYGLGSTLSQIVATFNYHLQMPISEGGLIEMWHRSAEVLTPWYEQLKKEALNSAVLHGDETGWRVNGRTHWLWCFGNSDVTYYMIDRSRGSPAINEFFQEFFDGVLITDFWAAYNAVCCADRQMCLVHLLGELKKVVTYKDSSGDWAAFSKKLKRLVQDAVRLWKRREEFDELTYASRRKRIELRLRGLIETRWDNSEAKRLRKRLDKYEDYLFTFLDKPYVPFDNNHAERSIRPAVIMRKNSYCNRSDRGARTQAILMSVFTTLKQRNLNPIKTVEKALRIYITTGKLSSLAEFSASDR
jgi:transposase